ncbi:MAG: hypothetical protein E6J34_14250 [Chloroflexi bacterium]|nr:MAG: hypothetical protein E6J34_14250 [Chloroflexota bacterium]
MQERPATAWVAVTHELKSAALQPEQREALLIRALQQLLPTVPACATALIWPCHGKNLPWKVYYVGPKRQALQRWLAARLNVSLQVTQEVLQQDLSSNLLDMPPAVLVSLRAAADSSDGALWLVWPTPSVSMPTPDTFSRVRQMFEALLEVEQKEEHYFSARSPLYDRELLAALAHGDVHAFSAFLSLARVVVQADFTFWAKVHHDVVETAGHLGAKHNNFGFVLERGRGVGGHIAAHGKPVQPGDYRNSPYRDPSVCDVVDREQIRCGMAVPIRAIATADQADPVAAVLYATRRTAAPFSLSEFLLLQRLASQLGPLPVEKRSSSFNLPAFEPFSQQKTRWYELIMQANRIEEVEAWASHFIKGSVIVTDGEGHPYVLAQREPLEQLQAASICQPETVSVLSLAAPGIAEPGQVYLCPTASISPARWSEFLADLIVACNVVLARMQQAHNQLSRQREQWVRSLLQGHITPVREHEGYRLGLPLGHGQLWVVAWATPNSPASSATSKRLTVEYLILELLKSTLIFVDEHTAVILLEGQATESPSKVRDALLTCYRSQPLWIVHGACYQSLTDLKLALSHSLALAQKARREESEEYLLDLYTFGLDSLLEDPRLSEALATFAAKLLAPLLDHDAGSSLQLTNTFVLAQTLGSAQAVSEQLGLHVNTIRYRLHRAEELLESEEGSPKERTALALAAFIWQHLQEGKPG